MVIYTRTNCNWNRWKCFISHFHITIANKDMSRLYQHRNNHLISVCFTFLIGLHFTLVTPNSSHLFTMFGIRGRSPASNICCFANADNSKPLPHTEWRRWLLETQHPMEAFCLTGEETKTQPWIRQARGPVNKNEFSLFCNWILRGLWCQKSAALHRSFPHHCRLH